MVGRALIEGLCGEDAQHLWDGMRWLSRAADTDHTGAAILLALIYDEGGAVPHDPQRAIRYYRQAAEQDVVDAQHRLGVLLVTNGGGAARQEGLYWLGAAAALGDGISAAFLGMLHADGLHGVPRDTCMALDWYEAGRLLEAPVPISSFVDQIPAHHQMECFGSS